jgi:hypothetical protein
MLQFFECFFWFIWVGVLLVIIQQWIKTFRIYGNSKLFLEALKEIKKSLRGTKNELRSTLGLTVLAIVLLFFSSFNNPVLQNLPVIIPFGLIIIAFTNITILLIPPVILYLTSSTQRSVDMMQMFRVRLRIRVISLLSSNQMEFLSQLTLFYSGSNFRTRNIINWRKKVNDYMKITPFIVIDLREKSQAVKEEVDLVLQSEKTYQKTLFLTDSWGGTLPYYFGEASFNNSQINGVDHHIVHEDALISILRLHFRKYRSKV